MSLNSIHLAIVAICTLMFVANCNADDKPTPLHESVAQLNEKLAAYPFDEERTRTRPLSDEKLPRPVTVEEVVAAIQNWDRTKDPISDGEYKLFQDIARTKTLPSKAKLYFRDRWRHGEPESKVEFRELCVDLSVMTGERTGYGFRIREQQLDERRYLKLSPGFRWIVNPTPAEPNDWNSGGVVFTILDDPNQALHALASTLDNDSVKKMNGVVFDSAGKRHELTKDRVGRHENMTMFRFRLKDEPEDAIEFFAIEGLTEHGERHLSRLAVQKAAKQNIHVLPLPILGDKFEFTLATADGVTIESPVLLGKVVIVDCWASWCGPCIKQFPKLKELCKQHKSNRLEIIGVSIDENPRAAETIYETQGIPWPLVTIPMDENARKLWNDAARIKTVPRVLVIDKAGVLRADGSELPFDLVLSLLEQD